MTHLKITFTLLASYVLLFPFVFRLFSFYILRICICLFALFLFYFSSFSNFGIFCVLFTYSFPFIAYSSFDLSCHPLALFSSSVSLRRRLCWGIGKDVSDTAVTSHRVMQIIRTVMVAIDRDECMISTTQTIENGISFQKIMCGQTVWPT